MKRRPAQFALLILAIIATRVIASGGPPPMPHYVLAAPQNGTERAALAGVRIGILKADTTDALLYLDWRALNGLTIGKPATDALASPCCGNPGSATYDWLQARRQVPGARQDVYYISTEREGANYTTIPNCFGRYGYRRVTALLYAAGWSVNHKRVEGIWRHERLKVPQRQPKRGWLWLNDSSCIRLRPEHLGHGCGRGTTLSRSALTTGASSAS